MKRKGLFSIKHFAKLSRTTQAALYHYDKIGLLSPHIRGNNRYRYYSSDQLAIINSIHISQKLGMTLDEIRSFKNNITPESAEALLKKQAVEIDRKINEWVASRNLSTTLQKCIQSCRGVDENAVTVQHLPAEAIVLGDLNDYSMGRGTDAAQLSFYENISKKYPELDLNYPVWGSLTEERVRNRDWYPPDRFYFYNPAGNDRRPAALYAVGYTRGGYGKADAAYKKCVEYIDANGFEICGNAYEEYPLNEFCIHDPAQYLIRVMITVRKK